MVYPDVGREHLITSWLQASVWSLSDEDHSDQACPQDFDDFLGEVVVELARDADEQERWYPLVEKASKPRRHLVIAEERGCSSSSLSTANQPGTSGSQPPPQEPCLTASE